MKILLAIALLVLVGCDYEERSAERERNAKLTYGPDGWLNWQYITDSDVQYAPYGGTMFLRKVKSEDHVLEAYFDEQGFHASAYWKVDCDEETEIATSRTYSDGSPAILYCERWGDSTWIGKHTVTLA